MSDATVDPKSLYGKCLVRTPDYDPTGNTPMGQAIDGVPPLYCGLPENHEGPHTWEQFLEGSLQNWAVEVVDAAGYTLTWELQSGGPGGHMAPVIVPKAGG